MSTVTATTSSVGYRLRVARLARGYALDEAAQRVSEYFHGAHKGGARTVSKTRVGDHENDLVRETNIDPAMMLAYACAYGVPIEQLSPVNAYRLRRMMLLLDTKGGDNRLSMKFAHSSTHSCTLSSSRPRRVMTFSRPAGILS